MGPGREEFIMIASAVIIGNIGKGTPDREAAKLAVARAGALADELKLPTESERRAASYEKMEPKTPPPPPETSAAPAPETPVTPPPETGIGAGA